MRKHFTKYSMLCFVFLALCTTIIAIIVYHCRKTETLSETEQFAMKALPGYFFVFEGETNYVGNAENHQSFVNQHPMIPYLELVTDRLEKRPWARNFAIRVRETDTQVIISLPSWAEQRGLTGPTVFDAGYSLEVTIDKKTMRIVSAFQG